MESGAKSTETKMSVIKPWEFSGEINPEVAERHLKFYSMSTVEDERKAMLNVGWLLC